MCSNTYAGKDMIVEFLGDTDTEMDAAFLKLVKDVYAHEGSIKGTYAGTFEGEVFIERGVYTRNFPCDKPWSRRWIQIRNITRTWRT